MTNQFYGDRRGTVIDPFGHKWTIALHEEDLSEKRDAALHGSAQQQITSIDD